MSVGVCIKLFYSHSSGNCFMTSVGHFDTCFQNVLVKKQRYLSLFLFFVISSFLGVGGGETCMDHFIGSITFFCISVQHGFHEVLQICLCKYFLILLNQ